jgi:hypothetical protein
LVQAQRIVVNKVVAITGIGLTVLVSGCSTVKPPTSSSNPPPTEVFSNFSEFELRRLDRTSSCEKLRGADKALGEVETKVNIKLRTLIKSWEESPTAVQSGRKLIIQPVCSGARMVGTAGRLGLGFAGGESAVALNVRYTDADSGKEIASPVFYQRSNGFGGAMSWGATDRNMLDRIASLVAVYTANNYEKAVGGPTGAEDLIANKEN